ncbi:sigma-54 interaction domain-containing protein [Azospirillum doebereinerae]|uniref:Sigma-54-dependent Fis family transcriptional regulator n=1 Tax=Azospirillum doebereinerae TaxID=92933 RepID=A0A3S0WUP5_9PROT|nr:sigma 54-interacting transcriptional regulator [Azospirillum doebereinerae]MCG5239945.1 sigma 54-interacting transcriptional regulator [Azospirillum doebereinerae]RUQ61039.1 sigma-54-dependent Fis family transcriptional regulator [Azospirillum doebereinerae]
MTQTSDATRSGVLVLDESGNVKFQSGLGERADVRGTLLGLRSQLKERRLFGIDVDGTHCFVLGWRGPDAALFLIHAGKREDTLLDFVGSVDFAYAILNHLVSSPYEGMTVVDDKAKIRFISPVHEGFFHLGTGEAVGKPVTEVIENTRLHEIVQSGKAEIGKIQQMRGVTRVVSRVPILENRKVVGAIGQVMFKAPEQLQQLSLEVNRLRDEVAQYKREISGLLNRSTGLDQIIGTSDAIRQLKADLAKVAPLDVPVLVIGESGTGKELVANALHSLSARHGRPMVMVNSAALPASLAESELFGYEPGAFTGAERKGRKGKFESAHKSTLFLDEVGDMPLDLQVKLLRILQDGVFERVGGEQQRFSDFRLVSATNRDLGQMIQSEKFRLDLYYRISPVTLKIPPLRERLEDIPAIVQGFLASLSSRNRSSVRFVDDKVYGYLQSLKWPGNVRQLLHEVERAAIFSDGTTIRVEDFRPSALPGMSPPPPPVTIAPPAATEMRAAVESVEESLIREALQRHGGNKKRVAEELGISRSYLYKRLRSIEEAV